MSKNLTLQQSKYAKSIIFDYSYKYFYLDGHVKYFSIINVRQVNVSERKFEETMFVASLLSFYEHLLVYEENKKMAAAHNLEKPLWIFVGTTVTGREEESDVIQIVEFIKRVIEDEKWVKENIEKILTGNTGLRDENNRDLFSDKFEYLKRRDIKINNLYKRIFGGKGAFGIYELKNAEGKFGLKIGENDYFGVINIGDTAGFKKELEKKGISVQQDVMSDSLFEAIKKENSAINILIGSKKFIEGWDTWRVSCMGLLNIGRGQGPQIIQLFGRGVRLKGKGMTLKRSAENAEIKILETLDIYGIKADYLTRFFEAISREEVELETLKIPVKPQHEDKWRSLFTLSKSEKKLEDEQVLKLNVDERINYTIDLVPKVSRYQSRERRAEGIALQEIRVDVEELTLPEDKIDLFNWEKIEQEIIEFKAQRGY